VPAGTRFFCAPSGLEFARAERAPALGSNHYPIVAEPVLPARAAESED
jgi:hypothetical protein